MLKKIAAGVSALALVTTLAACSSGKTGKELDEVDVNGLTISAACEKVREAGWNVSEVQGKEDRDEMSDCTDSEQKVVSSWFHSYDDSVTLYFPNEKKDAETSVEETSVEEDPVQEDQVEDTSAEDDSIEEASTVDSTSDYQAIYDEYSARLQDECPVLSMTECAELSNEGVSKMAEYMYKAKGTDGQYGTYEEWAQKLYDVYMSSVQF